MQIASPRSRRAARSEPGGAGNGQDLRRRVVSDPGDAGEPGLFDGEEAAARSVEDPGQQGEGALADGPGVPTAAEVACLEPDPA